MGKFINQYLFLSIVAQTCKSVQTMSTDYIKELNAGY